MECISSAVKGSDIRSEGALIRDVRAGGARLNAVAGGLSSRDENRSGNRLTPPVPQEEAPRVTAGVLTTLYRTQTSVRSDGVCGWGQ